jgi:hypothetical protein
MLAPFAEGKIVAEKKLGSFEAQKLAMLSNGVIYQTYVSDQRLVAVKTGSPMDGGRAWTMHFGLIGALIHYFLMKGVMKRRLALLSSNESLPLDELLHQDPKNFEVRYDGLERAELKKAGILKAGHAKLLLKRVGEEPIELSLQTKQIVAVALPVLEAGLQSRLEVESKLRPS